MNREEHDPQSLYQKELRERRKVNSAFFTASGSKKPKCSLCQQSLVTPAVGVGETPYMMCPDCGKRTTLEEVKNKTLTATSSKTGGPMIVSQVKKKRRGSSLDGELDEETEEDLIALGFGPTASFKDYVT